MGSCLVIHPQQVIWTCVFDNLYVQDIMQIEMCTFETVYAFVHLVICICKTWGTLVDLIVHIQSLLYARVTTFETEFSYVFVCLWQEEQRTVKSNFKWSSYNWKKHWQTKEWAPREEVKHWWNWMIFAQDKLNFCGLHRLYLFIYLFSVNQVLQIIWRFRQN